MAFLLASLLTCSEGRWILEGIAATDLTIAERSGLLIEIIQAMPIDCEPEDYNP